MSVRAAGIPVTSALSSPAILEVLPPSAALPVMAVAILSVWVAHCAPEASHVHESAPEVSHDHESAPKASPVHVSTPVPPEVAASAAEPPEVVVPTHELTVCPVTAMEVVNELKDCLVTATEAVHELTACPVMAKEAVHEFSACSVTATEAAANLSMLPALPAPPWLPAPPAPPWLPAPPVPLHGPGPPSHPLDHLQSSTLLDFLLFVWGGCYGWASGAAHRVGICHACFGVCFMFLFSCLLFWSLVMVPVCVMLPLPSCIHAIGSLVHCVMF